MPWSSGRLDALVNSSLIKSLDGNQFVSSNFSSSWNCMLRSGCVRKPEWPAAASESHELLSPKLDAIWE